MSEQKQYLTQFVPAIIPITFDFTAWNKSFDDIEEVKIVFKKLQEDLDSKYLEKVYTTADDDLTFVADTNSFNLKINQEDYENLVPDTYSLRLGLKFEDEDQFRDAGELESNEITVKASWFNKTPAQ